MKMNFKRNAESEKWTEKGFCPKNGDFLAGGNRIE